MAKKKAAGGIGVIVVVVIIVGMKLLGGPDLTALITGNSSSSNQSTQTEPASRVDPPKPAARAPASTGTNASAHQSEDDLLEQLFRDETSDEMITLVGSVRKSLPDDNEGSRHQKFIMEMASGRTVLVAHNIDLAEKVPLREGDTITLRGEYEWSDQGGVVHWTHHDPKQWREGGWIEHNGIRYE